MPLCEPLANLGHGKREKDGKDNLSSKPKRLKLQAFKLFNKQSGAEGGSQSSAPSHCAPGSAAHAGKRGVQAPQHTQGACREGNAQPCHAAHTDTRTGHRMPHSRRLTPPKVGASRTWREWWWLRGRRCHLTVKQSHLGPKWEDAGIGAKRPHVWCAPSAPLSIDVLGLGCCCQQARADNVRASDLAAHGPGGRGVVLKGGGSAV